MKKTHFFVLGFCLIALLAGLTGVFVPSNASEPVKSASTIRAYFSPNGGCTDAIVDELNKAKSKVLVQAYSFTSAPIAKALVDAKNRGVSVQVILDSGQFTDKYSSATFLKNQGISVFSDAKHGIAHNKIILIDSKVVITGSFNFSKAAEKSNAENLLVIHNEDLCKVYTENYEKHLSHSEKAL